eukprot:1010724-Prorocentrum_lima.AAC.1
MARQASASGTSASARSQLATCWWWARVARMSPRKNQHQRSRRVRNAGRLGGHLLGVCALRAAVPAKPLHLGK